MELVRVEFKDETISEGIMFNNIAEYSRYLKYISNEPDIGGTILCIQKRDQDLVITSFKDTSVKCRDRIFFTNTIPNTTVISTIGLVLQRKNGFIAQALYKFYDFISRIPDEPNNNDIVNKVDIVNITTKYTTQYGLDIFDNFSGILTKENIDNCLKGYNKYQIFSYICNNHTHIGIAKKVNKEFFAYNFYTKHTINLNDENKVEENPIASVNSVNVINIDGVSPEKSDIKKTDGKSKYVDIDSLTPFVEFKVNGITHYGIIIYPYHHLYNNLPEQSNILVYPTICVDSYKGNFIIKSDIPNPTFYIITTSRIEYCNYVYALDVNGINKITDISITCNNSEEIASYIDKAMKDFLR